MDTIEQALVEVQRLISDALIDLEAQADAEEIVALIRDRVPPDHAGSGTSPPASS
jgi:predicted LPLAT superfamily acyltransferase